MLPSQYLIKGLINMPMIIVLVLALGAGVVVYNTKNSLVRKITYIGLIASVCLMLTINIVTLYKTNPPKSASSAPIKKKQENIYFFNSPDTRYREGSSPMLPPVE
ncbi:MAG: hypothetical protein RSB66_05025 [Clostridium sp.]